jgi:small subunit ribosomal protein S16
VAVRIRLRRIGKKKQPQYRLVAAEASHPRDGRFIEVLGQYNPRVDPPAVSVNAERALYWLQHGAQPTDTAKSLLVKTGVWEQFTGEPAPAPPPAREAAAEAPVEAAPDAAEAAAPEAAEAAAEDAGDEAAPEADASAEPEEAGVPEGEEVAKEEEAEVPSGEAEGGTEAQVEGGEEETQQG